jgi:hypothetical protein
VHFVEHGLRVSGTGYFAGESRIGKGALGCGGTSDESTLESKEDPANSKSNPVEEEKWNEICQMLACDPGVAARNLKMIFSVFT